MSGALGPGTKTYWGWPNIAAAPTIEVTGGDGAFNIGDVRVVVTKRAMTCPRCSAACFALVFYDDWGCRSCCLSRGCNYRSNWHPSPMFRRQSILRRLARADPLSLKAYELERKLRRVDRAIVRRAKNVGNRIARSGRG
jgi:hypothetical protein